MIMQATLLCLLLLGLVFTRSGLVEFRKGGGRAAVGIVLLIIGLAGILLGGLGLLRTLMA